MSLTAILQLATAALCVTAQAAPPSSPHFFSATHRRLISPLDYYMDSPEMVNYYTLAQQKNVPSRAARLETLDPDSEVELVPGVQPPQQPLQPPQPPVAGNIPGLVPGQRVFIVHMPVPGYRPGTIGGYQPVYIVAAAPQGHYARGYQNTLLVDPSVQVVSPLQLRAAPPAPPAPSAPLAPVAPVAPVAPAAQPEPPVLLGTPLGYNAVNLVYNHRGASSSQGPAEQARSPSSLPTSVDNAPDKATGSEARRTGHKGVLKAAHESVQETGQSGSEETRESFEDTTHRAEDASIAHERHQSSDEALLHEDVTPKKLRHKQAKPVADSEETGDTSIEVTKTINASTVRYEGSKIIAEGSRGGGDAVQLYLLTQPRPGADGTARNSSEQSVQPVQTVQLVQPVQLVHPMQPVQLVQPVQLMHPVAPSTSAPSMTALIAVKPGKPPLPDEQDAQTDQTESEETAESTEDESSPEATTAHSSTDNSGEAARLLSGEDLEAQREVLRQQLRDMIDRIREQQRVQRRGDESGLGGGKRRRVAKGGERTARPGRRRQDPAPCTRHHAAHLQPDASLAHFYSG